LKRREWRNAKVILNNNDLRACATPGTYAHDALSIYKRRTLARDLNSSAMEEDIFGARRPNSLGGENALAARPNTIFIECR
jgi:hypothetical protein